MIKRRILEDFAVTDREADQITEDALSCYREWVRDKAAFASVEPSSELVRALLAEAARRRQINGE
jgi:hypothetical protein